MKDRGGGEVRGGLAAAAAAAAAVGEPLMGRVGTHSGRRARGGDLSPTAHAFLPPDGGVSPERSGEPRLRCAGAAPLFFRFREALEVLGNVCGGTVLVLITQHARIYETFLVNILWGFEHIPILLYLLVCSCYFVHTVTRHIIAVAVIGFGFAVHYLECLIDCSASR